MTVMREHRNWNLRRFKDISRIRGPRSWHVFHVPTGLCVGEWRDKGQARRFMRSSPAWRVAKGVGGPKGWVLRRTITHYSLS